MSTTSISTVRSIKSLSKQRGIAEEQLKTVISSQEEARKAGQELLQKLDLESCLLTQGRGGMTLFTRGQEPIHVNIIGEDEVFLHSGMQRNVINIIGSDGKIKNSIAGFAQGAI